MDDIVFRPLHTVACKSRCSTCNMREICVPMRMSRDEIGSFLGLKLETVSRTLSKFQTDGLLVVRQRQIRITDPGGLKKVLETAES